VGNEMSLETMCFAAPNDWLVNKGGHENKIAIEK
jgi:hypothetical protein